MCFDIVCYARISVLKVLKVIFKRKKNLYSGPKSHICKKKYKIKSDTVNTETFDSMIPHHSISYLNSIMSTVLTQDLLKIQLVTIHYVYLT